MKSLLRFVKSSLSITCSVCAFILLLTVACQPVQPTPIFSPTFPTMTPVREPTATQPVSTSLPAATIPPISPEPASNLLSGPWLVYRSSDDLILVSQEGTRQPISKFTSCDFENSVDIQENSQNQLVILSGKIYLLEPSQATASLIYSQWPTCRTDFTGDEKAGLLASIYVSASNAAPELRIYEVPSGKMLDRFSLYKCSEQNGPCNMEDANWWQVKWSPNGRYLAFPAVLDGPSSDLYVYDTENHKTRRLTSGAEDVGQIWWSQDGDQIIMGEILDKTYPATSSVWAVSVNTSDIRLLYSLDPPTPQGVLGWLDNQRFIVYDGISLFDPMELPAYNLRLVDMDSGEIKTLFNGSFVIAELDKKHETLAFYAYDPDPRPGYEGLGVYLVSASKPRIRFITGATQPVWDEKLGLFVTDAPCENEITGIKAFNYSGEWQCIHQTFPNTYPSPDGQRQISIRDGTWLESNARDVLQVNVQDATQAIWRPDSQGFFFVIDRVLYYASLPELKMTIVDEQIGNDMILYQWLE